MDAFISELTLSPNLVNPLELLDVPLIKTQFILIIIMLEDKEGSGTKRRFFCIGKLILRKAFKILNLNF